MATLLVLMPAGAAATSLRFHGTGAGDVDRVKIRIDDPATGVPGPPADVGAADFTLEFWMKATAAENPAPGVACGDNLAWIYGHIVFDRDRYNQDRKFGVSLARGRLVFGVSGDATGDATVCGAAPVLDGQWHHVAVQRRRADGWLWIFVDGALDGQGPGPGGDVSYPDAGVPGDFCGGPCTNSDPFLVIGAEKHDAGPAYPSYRGYLDEVRLSRTLRYAAPFARPTQPFAPDADTVALYHLDEGAGDLVADAAGAPGGPSHGVRHFGGAPAGPEWSTDTPFGGAGPLPFTGGLFVAAGDLDGDGRAEIVTGPGPGRGARLRAFAPDGTPHGAGFDVYAPAFTGGIRVAACDFDGDGRAELVTAAGPGGGPHVRVMAVDPAGAFAGDLASFLAYDPGFTGGLFVACGDLDGDGRPDLLIGVDAGGGPHVRALRLLPGGGVAPLVEFLAYEPGFRGGIRVAAANLDGGDRAALILGAGPGGGPHVRALKWTGTALLPLADFFAYDPGFRQGVFVAAGNLGGDGRAEILTSADAGGGPHVRVFTGTGAPAGVEFFAYDAGFTGGVRIAVGDVDGAGHDEILTGAGPGGGAHVGLFTSTGAPLNAGFLAY
jgi:hypothetical protein